MSIISSSAIWKTHENKFTEDTVIFSFLSHPFIFPALLKYFFPNSGNEFNSTEEKIRFLQDNKNLKKISNLIWQDEVWWEFFRNLEQAYQENEGFLKLVWWFSRLDKDFLQAILYALRDFSDIDKVNNFVEELKQRVIDNLFKA